MPKLDIGYEEVCSSNRCADKNWPALEFDDSNIARSDGGKKTKNNKKNNDNKPRIVLVI